MTGSAFEMGGYRAVSYDDEYVHVASLSARAGLALTFERQPRFTWSRGRSSPAGISDSQTA